MGPARRSRCSSASDPIARLVSVALVLGAACSDDSVASSVEPIFGDPCKLPQCSAHGHCEPDARGEPACVCDLAYAGARCDACAPGFHLGVERTCLPDQRCLESDPCGRHGTCSDDTGGVICTCDPGYEGASCDLCAPGYGRSELGECLQLVLSRGDAGPLPEACTDTTCSGHGQCSEIAEGIICECFPGYQGVRCAECVDGYLLRGDRCVADVPCEVDDCGLCEQFAEKETFPARPDNCFSSDTLDLGELSMRSLSGEGTVWLCGPSTYYGLSSEHVALEAGPELPAQIVFRTPITRISFDYGIRSLGVSETVPLEFAGDDHVVASFDDRRGTTGPVDLSFDEPIEVLSVRSLGSFTEEVAIDNLVYERAACD